MTADDWAVVTCGEVEAAGRDFNGRNYTMIGFDWFGGETLLAGYTIDITERKQAE